MKRIITIGFLIATTFFQMTPQLNAQAGVLRARVPFPFAVGNQVLPPGAYEIKRQGSFIRLQNRDRQIGIFVLPAPGDRSYDGRSRLMFDSLDGTYFLRKIVTTSSMTSLDFPKFKLEKRANESGSSIFVRNSGR